MNSERKLRFFCLLFAISWLAGCAALSPEKNIVDKLPPPIILNNIRQNSETIKAIKAQARVSLQSMSNSGNGIIEMRFQRGEKLRIVFHGPLGIGLFALKWTGSVAGDTPGSLEVYIPTEQCLFILNPDIHNLQSLTGLSLDFSDLVNTFIRPLGDPDDKWSPGIRNRKLLLTRHSGLTIKRVWIGGEKGLPLKYETFDERGSPILQKTLLEYRNIEGIFFPMKMLIKTPTEIVQVRFQKVEINPILTEDDFELEIPENTERVRWVHPLSGE